LVLGTITALPFRDASFDVVVCSEVLEHVWDTTTAFVELKRVTRPGGWILVTVPFVYPLHEEPYDFVRLTPYSIQRHAAAHRLEVEKLERAGNEGEAIAVLLDRWVLRSLSATPSLPLRVLAAGIRLIANIAALLVGGGPAPTEPVAFVSIRAVLRRADR